MPLSSESVIVKLDVELRTQTPVREVDELPALRASRMRKNPIKATIQLELINNRISGHQGISPTSILNTVDQFGKGTGGIVHQIAILKSGGTDPSRGE